MVYLRIVRDAQDHIAELASPPLKVLRDPFLLEPHFFPFVVRISSAKPLPVAIPNSCR